MKALHVTWLKQRIYAVWMNVDKHQLIQTRRREEILRYFTQTLDLMNHSRYFKCLNIFKGGTVYFTILQVWPDYTCATVQTHPHEGTVTGGKVRRREREGATGEGRLAELSGWWRADVSREWRLSCSAGFTCLEVRFARGLLLFWLRSGVPFPRIAPFSRPMSSSPPTCLRQVCLHAPTKCLLVTAVNNEWPRWASHSSEKTGGRRESLKESFKVHEALFSSLSTFNCSEWVTVRERRLLSNAHITKLSIKTRSDTTEVNIILWTFKKFF